MAREHGLPPAILGRDQPMSDKAQAILMNPFYLVERVEPLLDFERMED